MKRLYDKALMDQIAKVYGNEVAFLSEFSKALLDIIREGLIRDGQVRLHQFGTFKLKWMKSRNGVNPSTGKKIVIQARPRVVFVPAKALKERIEPQPPVLQPFDPEENTKVSVVASILKESTSIEVEETVEEVVKAAEPEKVVADIQDEIEVLEQVVEILKTETPEAAGTVATHSKATSEWIDKSVVENIKEISELQYFKKAEGTVVKPQQQTSIKENAALDIDLSSLSQTPVKHKIEINNETGNKGGAWFAIATTALILLAAGVLFNALILNKPVVNTEQVASQNSVPKYVFSYSELTVNEKVVTSPVYVPVEIINDNVEYEVLVSEAENTESDQSVITPLTSNEPDTDSIIVSTEKYDEVQRSSAEKDVFFSEVEYQLANGDSLWRLAKKHYVNPFYWPHIYQANRNKINNPDKVKIGKFVSLPTLYGRPEALTQEDKHNIAMGYYYNYLYHKGKGNPYAYFSLIGVDKYDASILIEYKEEIEYSDVDDLALLTE